MTSPSLSHHVFGTRVGFVLSISWIGELSPSTQREPVYLSGYSLTNSQGCENVCRRENRKEDSGSGFKCPG